MSDGIPKYYELTLIYRPANGEVTRKTESQQFTAHDAGVRLEILLRDGAKEITVRKITEF